MNQQERLLYLIEYLMGEAGKRVPLPREYEEQFRLFRSLVNIRPPRTASLEFSAVQDSFLQEEIAAKGITDLSSLTAAEKGIYLWQGDITTLKCGAIVNAANSQLLGCFHPCHGCIDNAIHTFSGVQLRLECAQIMERQGHDEPVGRAKVTGAYNLPCGHIIHTVGPYVERELTEEKCRQLAECYASCLKAAAENNIKSLAFCCISTGVFGFPKREAAEIAVSTVRRLGSIYGIEVIFNVYTGEDLEIYRQLLG